MDTRKIIGYQPIYEAHPGAMAAQAFITCSKCGKMISGTGGPREICICLSCMEDKKF